MRPQPSLKELIDEPNDQPIINASVSQRVSQSTNQLFIQYTSHSNQSTNKPINQSIHLLIYQLVCQSIEQTMVAVSLMCNWKTAHCDHQFVAVPACGRSLRLVQVAWTCPRFGLLSEKAWRADQITVYSLHYNATQQEHNNMR